MSQEMIDTIIGNAPSVIVLMYIVFRFEQRLAECHNAITAMLERHLEAMHDYETSDPV